MQQKGILMVISGPSGVGKGTICKELRANRPSIKASVSVTSRAPRNGEKDGVDYFFVSRERFDEMAAGGELLEYNYYNNNGYGTPRDYVLQMLEGGNDVLLEIDVHGALNVTKIYPDAVTIFILPPSKEDLRARLVGRGTEDAETIAKRLAAADWELSQADKYRYRVVNAVVADACREIEEIMDKEHNR